MISVTMAEGVAVVMLQRTEKRNAMTPEMLGSLVSAVAPAHGDHGVQSCHGAQGDSVSPVSR